MPSGEYLSLGERVYLKRLEFPAVYDAAADDLYEVDESGFAELARCDGTLRAVDAAFPADFLEFCLDEGVLALSKGLRPQSVKVGENETPSLRYLLVEITEECNLTCRHCYLGDGTGLAMPIAAIERLADEFEEIGGLRLIITGGEPLLHPDFGGVSATIQGRAFRSVLITNGTLIDETIADGLRFDEVQVSLDGLQAGHDFLRGEGAFQAAMRGIERLRNAGVEISIATMVHKRALAGLDGLEELVRTIGATSWTLDVACEAGRMEGSASGIVPDTADAAPELARAFGSEQHRPSGEHACGAHLARVRADGLLTKCGFYGEEWSGGAVEHGLRGAWRALERLLLSDLECDCEYRAECGGGCRYRAERTAGRRTAPDPFKCAAFGISRP